jgi:mono/diheme cytochrome c family protein
MLEKRRRFRIPASGGPVVAVVACGLAGVLAAGCGGRQGEAGPKNAVEAGKTTYGRYCTSCHGREGRGDGPVAADLSVPVTDLTLLAANNGGTYPEERVTQVLARGGTVRGHGSDDMPAWGPAFSRTEGTGTTTVDDAFRNLNQYLRTIQRSK